ncbi:MAG TPA: response regulator transcription factor [Actinomycetota bacterium]|nr:response regulator transcription factor [Actinomycetota bacterium]
MGDSPEVEGAGAGRREIRVMVVDDHQLLAESLLMVLDEEPDMTVVATAASVAEARLNARRHTPDVVLMDYRLPDGLGTDAARFIREENPIVRVVMLTGFPDDAILVAAIEAGCSGYITKDSAVSEAISAVRAAYAGEALISPSMLARLLPKLRRDYRGVGSTLTDREREVLSLLAGGSQNSTVADQLFLSVNTVRKHVQSILSKLGAHSKLEAVAVAVREGIIDLGEDPRRR